MVVQLEFSQSDVSGILRCLSMPWKLKDALERCISAVQPVILTSPGTQSVDNNQGVKIGRQADDHRERLLLTS